MDFSYSHTSTEKKSKEAFRFYFNAIYSNPFLIVLDIFIIIFLPLLMLISGVNDLLFLVVCLAVMLVVLKPLKWFILWNSFKKALYRANVFNMQQEIRLTDDFIEVKRGDSFSKTLYRECYTHYMLNGETSVIFLNGRFFAGGLDLSQLKQAGLMNEFLAAQEKAGVKRKAYRPWINTCDNILRIAAIVIFIMVFFG